MSKQSKSQPTHRAYSTYKTKDGNIMYRQIGALWPHKTEKGKRGEAFWLKLELIPTDGSLIAIGKIEEQRKAEQTGWA